MACLLSPGNGPLANAAEIGSDLVGQHFFQPQPEKVRGIAAVRPCHHVASKACRPSWASMACRTTIRETSTNGTVDIEVTCAVAFSRALPYRTSEFALKELPAPANRTKRV